MKYSLLMEDKSRWTGEADTPMAAAAMAEKEKGIKAVYFVEPFLVAEPGPEHLKEVSATAELVAHPPPVAVIGNFGVPKSSAWGASGAQNLAEVAAVGAAMTISAGSWMDSPGYGWHRRVRQNSPGSPKWKKKARKAQKLARRKQRGK